MSLLFTAPLANKWLYFNGSAGSGAAAVTSGLTLSSTMSFAGWFFITSLATASSLFGTPNDGSGHDMMVRVETNGSVTFFASTGGTAISWPAGTIVVNTLYHLVFTYDGAHAIMYRNAVSQGSVAYTVAFVTGVGLGLGFRDNTQNLTGFAGPARAWSNYVLTSTDVSNLYSGAVAAVPRTNLTLEWLMKENRGITLRDTSGSGNSGTLGTGVSWQSGRSGVMV